MDMVKISRAVEIIPVGNSSGLQQPQQPSENINKMSVINDPFIVKRVQQYLETNTDKKYVDITDMADFLQAKYKEYTRRKRSAFRGLVKRAYSLILNNYGDNINVSSSESEVDDCEVDQPQNNTMNSQLIDMYTRGNQPLQESELIDISSDDSDEFPDAPQNNIVNSNGSSAAELNSDAKFSGKSMILAETSERGRKRKNDFSNYYMAKKRKEVTLHESVISFKNVGGMDEVLKEVTKLLLHMRHPEIYRELGVSPPRGFLLHGPPGCGKTLLATAIAGELKVPLLKVAAPELVGGVSGESEERIRELFDRAVANAPCILFIDEIDAITQNRQQAQKDMERRIVAQLLTCLDDLSQNENGDDILVIGATNRPDSLDPALRRAGRFDREVSIGIPNVESRMQILKILTEGLKLASDFDYLKLAKNCPGFVGADLMALTREAALAAINKIFKGIKAVPVVKENGKEEKSIDKSGDEPNEKPNKKEETETKQISNLDDVLSWLHCEVSLTSEQIQNMSIKMEDFDAALKCVQPSAKREGFATVPDVTWDDIGSLSNIREELQLTILAPIRYAEHFKSLGITNPSGVLLCGPPGCGKTLLAKAIANEAEINFISVKGPELLNMYVGESERAVRQCFQRAKNSAPCVIFFDELDALCPKRTDFGEGGASMRVVNQMLTEMDGVEGREGVFLMAASNRPDIIDPAVLRPGRLDKILYVGLPSAEDRVDILKALTKKVPALHAEVDLENIAKCNKCDGFTGADLSALVREASIEALKDIINKNTTATPVVTNDHFYKALNNIRPSVTEKDQKHYEKLQKLYGPNKETSIPEEEVMECS